MPILALCASVSAEDREARLAAGMDGHLAKPVRREALEQALASVLVRPVAVGAAGAGASKTELQRGVRDALFRQSSAR